MSDLKLVSPDTPSPLEQQLLDAVANEAPSAEQRMRVRLALGLPLVAAAPVPMPPVGRRALLLKAAGGLVVVSAAVALFLAMGQKSNADKPTTVAPITQQTPAAPPGVPDVNATLPAAPAASEAAVASAAIPSHDAHDDSAPSKRSSKPATVENGADLSEQLRLIDAARSAVASGNASAASAALSTYASRFPRGPFGQEAAVLQIETLDLQGNHALAAARARSFLARHPNSPHVSVVKRIADH